MNIRLKIIGMAVIIVILSAIGGSWVVYDMLQAEKRFAYYADVCWPATDMIMETNVQQQDILREVFEADGTRHELDMANCILDSKPPGDWLLRLDDERERGARRVHRLHLHRPLGRFPRIIEAQSAIYTSATKTQPAGYKLKNVTVPASLDSYSTAVFEGEPVIVTSTDHPDLKDNELFVVEITIYHKINRVFR